MPREQAINNNRLFIRCEAEIVFNWEENLVLADPGRFI